MRIYKLKYKNTTFGSEYTDYISATARNEDIHAYVFNHMHRYCGNHALGHGEYEIYLELYSNYPPEYISNKRVDIQNQIRLMQDRLNSLEVSLRELNNEEAGIKIEGEDFKLYGGGLPSKEEVLKDYCDGDEEEFNERYSKYYK